MAHVGYGALVLTLVASLSVFVASLLGTRKKTAALVRSARIGAFAAAALATLASAALLYLLLDRDFGVQYVYAHVDSYLPALYTISAFWAGQEGSLLLWLWLIALLTAWAAIASGAREGLQSLVVLAVMSFCQAFLALVLLVASNPFALLPTTPLEGRGLNPLLQNVWMVAHPPVVFMGYATYTVPFALAIGGLIANRFGDDWLRAVRRWALWAWLFLGTGIVMGAWWAYLELGWGGYWGWDPVENSSLIPWLTGTALLHSLLVQQRRKTFRRWSLWLILLTFALCIFATFVTRSGVIQSVHAFGQSAVGYSFLAFIVLCVVVFAVLLSVRRQALDSPETEENLFSRETGLLLTNLLLCGTALVILLGTLFPAITEVLWGRQAALDVSFYERTVGPLAQLIVVLMGVCPWLAWGGVSPSRLRRALLPPALIAVATAGLLLAFGVTHVAALLAFGICAFVLASIAAVFWRDLAARLRNTHESPLQAAVRLARRSRRRYGAHVVHLGMVLIAAGVTGSSVYQDEAQVALAVGERMDVQGYTLAYQDLVSEALPSKQLVQAVLDVYRGQHKVATLTPEKSFHWNAEQWVTEVAIRSTWREDLYVVLAGFEEDGVAVFWVLINPLVAWLWAGGAALLLGGFLAWWPSGATRGRPGNEAR